jgi:hypothetical protein
MAPIHRVQHLTSTDEIFGKRRLIGAGGQAGVPIRHAQ